MGRPVLLLGGLLVACGASTGIIVDAGTGADGDASEGDPPTCADADFDGHAAMACGGDDCDDTDPSVHPGAVDEGPERDGEWVVERASERGRPSLVVDAAGAVHIAYFDERTYELHYASDAGGSWSSDVVDPQNGAGFDSSITVDAAGAVHVAYLRASRDEDHWTLRHATLAGGAWDIETIDSTVLPSNQTAIHAATDGAITVAYRDVVHVDRPYSGESYCVEREECDAAMTVAIRAPLGDWASEHVEIRGGVGWDPAMLVAPSGLVHVAYPSLDPSDDFTYASGGPGSWAREVVDSARRVGQGPAIATDASGAIHMIYSRYNDSGYGRAMKYATRARGETTWSIETIEELQVGETTGIVVDTRGRVHAVYRAEGALRHAVRQGEVWTFETIPIENPSNFGTALRPSRLDVAVEVRAGIVHATLALAVDRDCDGISPE